MLSLEFQLPGDYLNVARTLWPLIKDMEAAFEPQTANLQGPKAA